MLELFEERKTYSDTGLHGTNKDFICKIAEMIRELKPSDLHVTEKREVWYRKQGKMHKTDLLAPEGGVQRLLTDLFCVPGSFARSSAACFLPNFPNRLRLRKSQSMERTQLFVRLLPLRPPTKEEIGVSELFSFLGGVRPGMVVVSGATGSGKSTALAAVLQDYLNTMPVHITTVEDPVEYYLDDGVGEVSQREIPDDVPTMAQAVKNALREDPDIIFIGEIRDGEVARRALEASQTGHMVFSTLHAPSAEEVKIRLMGLLEGLPDCEHRVEEILLASVHLSVDTKGNRKGSVLESDGNTRHYTICSNKKDS